MRHLLLSACLGVTALFAAYPHTREAFLQFNSNGGVFESVFLLGAMVSFAAAITRSSRLLYALSLALWACALSSYEQSYAFFVLFPLIAYWVGSPADRTLGRLAAHTVIFGAAVALMQIAHAKAVPAYRENVIVNPWELVGRFAVVLQLLRGQISGSSLWSDRSAGWGLPAQRALSSVDFGWMAVIVVAFAIAFWMPLRHASTGTGRRVVATFGFGLFFLLTGAAYFIFREGAGWYSRHHYTSAIGLALVHCSLLWAIAGKGSNRLRHAVAALVLAGVMAPMIAAQINAARAVAIWGDNLETIRQDMLRLAPNPPPDTNVVVLGDVLDRTGWVASDGGVWLPQVWYRRPDVVGKMGNGDDRFVPLPEGWHWLEISPTQLAPYARLLLLRLDHGRLHRIDRLELELPDGQRRTVELPGASRDDMTERRRVDAVPKTTWTWNR